ncbi:MAG: 6-pyruvoyl-tetrahydropterin synthase-related protein [Pseudomonadota bacterium]
MTRQGLSDLLVVGGATALVAWLLPWGLIFSPGAPTGGDTPTHYAAFLHLRQALLPQGRLWGWDPGSLAGYPAFQFYFPLPFLLMSLLGLVLHPAVAFKLVSLLPALAMPGCAYLCARGLGMRSPGPAMAAALVLGFLLREEGAIWGGSLDSALMGQFCQSWGIALALLYLGSLARWLGAGRGLGRGALLLWLIGLCHPYALLFCLVAGLYFPLSLRPWSLPVRRLLVLQGLAFLLWGHWLLPMLVYSPYTEKFNFIWALDSWRQLFPTSLLPGMLLGGLGALLALWGGEKYEKARAGFLGFWVVATALLYLVSPWLNTVTVRFLPFAYLALVLLAAQALARLARPLAAKWALALMVLLAGGLLAGLALQNTPRWLEWNYSGSQHKPLWPEFRQLNQFLAGDFGQPRVLYEHSPLHQGAGSLRAWESLPLWSGRATLESAYLQASPSAPFIFYLQSETAQRGSMPLPGYVFSRFNLPRALEHMRLFNVGQYLAVETASQELADQQPGLALQRRIGPYAVYRLLDNQDRYVVTPRYWPVLVVTSRPQELAYLWFRFCDPEVPLVFVERLTQEDRARFPSLRQDSGRDDDPLLAELRQDLLPRLPLMASPPAGEEIANERMEARGVKPGQPLLVKMSYHPAWRCLGGERIYRATPAFMLVFPQKERLTLVFGWAWPHLLGLGLSVLGLAGLLGGWRWPALGGRLAGQGTAQPGRSRGWWAVWGLLGLGLAAGLWLVHDDASTLLARGRALAQAGRLAPARQVFQQGLKRFPRGLVSDYTRFDLALTYHQEGQYARAAQSLQALREDYPDSILLPETLYYLAVCLRGAGQAPAARAPALELLKRFPATPWSRRAQVEGLAEGLAPGLAPGPAGAP